MNNLYLKRLSQMCQIFRNNLTDSNQILYIYSLEISKTNELQ